MEAAYPASWSSLKHPWTRRDLIETFRELAADDPCTIWEDRYKKGQLGGFSWFIVDWLFDDVVTDKDAIGFCLFDMDEVRAVDAVKVPISKISNEMPHAQDAEVVAHPLWPEVKRLSQIAADMLEFRAC